MPQPRTARAVNYANAVVLTFPYDAELVEALKREIPAYSRTYDPDTRAWTVKEPHTDRAIRLLRTFFPGAEVVTAGAHQHHAPPPRRPEPLARPDHFAVLHILPSAPAEVARAAYTALVKLHHPDRLLPPERDRAHLQMVALNAAIEALRGEGRA